MNGDDAQRCFDGMVAILDKCDDSMDIIVLPEYTDVPVARVGHSGYASSIAKYNNEIISRAKETAIRCNAIVFVNAACMTGDAWRNTT